MNIGIDIGGSHIGIGLFDEEKLVSKKEEDLNKLQEGIKKSEQEIKESIIKKITKNLTTMLNENNVKINEIDTIGVSSPGETKDEVIYNMVNLGISKFEIVDMLKKEFKDETPKIKLMNDAKCAGIAEFKYGCMKECSNGIFLTLGTGIGGAVFISNKLVKSGAYLGSEFGHMVIEKNGRQCKCGNKGCFETYCSMKVLKDEVKREYFLEENVSSEEIIEIIKKEITNPKMQKIIDNYIDYLCIGIVNLVNLYEPEIVGIGGSAVYLKDIILSKLKTKILQENLLFNKREDMDIRFAILGNDAGIYGAASL